MPNITRILCPVDFSETSEAAFKYAEDFASWVGASVVVAHAFDRPENYDYDGQRKPFDPSIKKKMLEIESRHENVILTHVVHAGDPGKVICWFAEDLQCDMIIMGTHGRTGLMHMLFGSTAEYVLKHARCPVMTIRPQNQDLEALPEPIVAPLPAPRYL